MHLLVSYDITADRRRTKLAKALKGFLDRVQKSVFEGRMPGERLEALQDAIQKQIDPSEDSVRIYRLCRRCRCAIDVIGRGDYVEDEQDEIV